MFFFQTLNSMDIMLRTLLTRPPASSIWDRVNIVLQVCNLHSVGFTGDTLEGGDI